MDNILEVKNITKIYPGVIALDKVSMDFRKGEVHAIIGENGAGKSTLIKVLSGSIFPDSGEIHFENNVYDHMLPRQALDLGISVIYQEFSLVPQLSVAENIFLGNRLNNGIHIDKRLIESKTEELMEQLGIQINPKKIVKDLSPAYQQITEILRAISRNVKILIMDEPSAPLTNAEVKKMFKMVMKLKKQGITIIYISHRMKEIFQIADRVSVMRDGHHIITKDVKHTNEKELISYMVGRELGDTYPDRSHIKVGRTILEVKNLTQGDKLKNISFKVKEGEILGIAGLVGAGRTELVRCIYGADDFDKGEILVDGQMVKIPSPDSAIKKGIALIPEDRKQQGVLMNLSVGHNISLPILRKLSKGISIKKKEENGIVDRYIKDLSIKTPSKNQKVRNLSGGNQQKVVLAKWLATMSNILIFDEPTRGIDVGAKHEIYELMNKLAEEGKAIIMISSDMPELLGMSDRILVMHSGTIVGELNKGEITQEKILELASGIA